MGRDRDRGRHTVSAIGIVIGTTVKIVAHSVMMQTWRGDADRTGCRIGIGRTIIDDPGNGAIGGVGRACIRVLIGNALQSQFVIGFRGGAREAQSPITAVPRPCDPVCVCKGEHVLAGLKAAAD